MHTPQDRDSNGPGGSGASRRPAGDSTNAFQPKGSSLVRLTPMASAPDLLSDDPGNTDDFPTVITPSTLDPANPALVPGSRLGSYELLGSIGAGGMATVLKARDVDLGREVALKILPPATARDSEAVKRFKLEARAAAKLDHENIARVYNCGEDRGLHFIAFEFVEGENLRQRIDRLGRISPADAVHYLLQLSAGLAHAAERGVIHRDIKPSNILITPDGRAKIVDMGLARHLEGHSFNGGVTQSGVTLGTFDYISPEQALDPRRADIRSDIYSLGCAFYHALTGVPPVPEGTAAKKLHAHEHEFPTDPRDLNPLVPDGLAMVLAKMMAKRPTLRYQTPADLTRDLTLLPASAASGTLAVPRGLSSAHAALPAAAGAVPRLPLAWLAAVAVVAVAAALYFGSGSTPPQSSVAPWHDAGPKKPEPTPVAPHPAPPTPVEPRAARIPDARALAESLARQGDRAVVQLRPGAVYDLTSLSEGILFTGTELVIEPEPGAADRSEFARPVLRILANPPEEKAARPGTLTARDVGHVVLRGVEILVERAAGVEQPEDDPIGLLLTNVGRTEIENCLIRGSADARKGRTVGVAVERDARGKPGSFALRRSVVDVGLQGIGLRLAERTETELTEVGFAPHQSAVLWADDAEESPAAADGKPALTIQACTFMFDRGGAALTVDQRALCAVALAGNVFADAAAPDEKLMMPGDDGRTGQPVVLRADPAQPDVFRLLSTDGQAANAYYHVVPPTGETRAIQLVSPPWAAADPRPLVASTNPWAAFQLNLNEKRLRVNLPQHVLGMVSTELPDGTPRKIYDGTWPPPKPALPVRARPGQRVVYADAAPEDSAARVYPTVAKAFEDLMAGETLLIAQTGRVPISSLPEKALRATVTAYEGFAPILVPSEEPFRRADASLFPLADGELTLAGLQIQLAGRAAVVTMAGGTTCTIRNCTILLDEKDDEPASLIVLTEPMREMKVGAADPANPQIHLDNTLVHGRGKVVVLRSPRAFEWTAENCAFALDGTVVQAEAAVRDATPPRATVKWKGVTAATTGPLFDLRGTGPRLQGFDVTCDHCLLTSCTRRRAVPPMILVHESDAATDPTAALTWRGDNANLYGNYDPLLEVRATGTVRSVEWDAAKWLRFTGETGRAGVVRFASPSLSPTKLRNLKPDDLRAETETAEAGVWRPIDAGADLTKLPKTAEKPLP